MTTAAARAPARSARASRAGVSWYASLVAVVAAFVVADVAVVWVGIHGDWAFDFACCYQQAGQRLIEGADLYAWSDTYTFRYSPWAALVFAPLAPLDPAVAALTWLVVKVMVLVGAAWWYARPWSGSMRISVAAAVVTFPPVVHDLVIGNVSTFTLVVLLALARGARAGPPLFGLLLLLAPKPHLVPVAAWLVISRPREAGIAIATAAIGLGAGIVAFGLDTWLAFVRTFAEPLGREFTANMGLSGLWGPVGVVAGALLGLAVFVLALRRRDRDGLSLAIYAGALASPYLFIHYLAGVLVAVEPLLRKRPRWLAAFPPVMVVVFPLMAVWVALLAVAQYLSAGTTRREPRDSGAAREPGASLATSPTSGRDASA